MVSLMSCRNCLLLVMTALQKTGKVCFMFCHLLPNSDFLSVKYVKTLMVLDTSDLALRPIADCCCHLANLMA